MKTRLWVLLQLASLHLFAGETLITNVSNRQTTSLNGKWKCIIDPYENGYYDYRYQPFDQTNPNAKSAFFNDAKQANRWDLIEYDFDKAETLMVPGDWNTQQEKLFYYEGTIWYRKQFDFIKKIAANRIFIHFGGANYTTEVYLNGKKLGIHVGGFTPFNFEISSYLKAKGNSLVIKVDNKRCKECVPTLNTDWWNYGGITRDVNLIEVPETFIEDYHIQPDKNNPKQITGFVKLNGNKLQTPVSLKIPEAKINLNLTPNAEGIAELKFKVDKLIYWTPQNPKLYDIQYKAGNEILSDQIGFRTISTKGTDILLNTKPIFLKGICLHEENPLRGARAFSNEDVAMQLNWAKELGCNFIRLSHYPHSENMARLADKMGMLLWEEIPVYWTIAWQNENTYKNAENQLHELITRDRNRASVIIWSMANETPVNKDRTQFLSNLTTKARSMDPNRLISAALEKHVKKDSPLTQVVEDPFAELVDVLSFNEYVGWYDGTPDKCSKVIWEIPYQKPVIISEFGGDALAGYHGDSLTIFTEEYQEWFYKESLAMISKIPQLCGISPWILSDFRSPRRLLTNIQDGWNRKGVIGQRGERKKAFYVLQEYYKSLEQNGKMP